MTRVSKDYWDSQRPTHVIDIDVSRFGSVRENNRTFFRYWNHGVKGDRVRIWEADDGKRTGDFLLKKVDYIQPVRSGYIVHFKETKETRVLPVPELPDWLK